MAHHSLRIAAAYHALGMQTTDQLVRTADDALNYGVYSYSLGELATISDPRWFDCSQLFVAAMQELQVPLPNPAAAIKTLLEYHVVRMAEGVASVEQTLYELYSIERELRYDPYPPVKVAPDDLKPLRPFIDHYHRLDEYHAYQSYYAEQSLPQLDENGLITIRAEAITLANEWCRNRWGAAIDRSWLTSNVQALARAVHANKAFDRLPILADALQEAGCENELLLEHLRIDSPHVRGCYVVDLLLDPDLAGADR